MYARAWLVGLVLLGFTLSGWAGDRPDPPNSFTIDEFLLQSLPGGAGLANFVEMVAADATSLIEESNGFASLDRPRVYYEGLSTTQTQWRYDGFAVNSVMEDGAPAFTLPRLAQSAFSLQGQTPWTGGPRLEVSAAPSFRGLRLAVSGALPRLGGTTGLGWLLVPNLAAERGQIFATHRRRLDRDFTVDALWQRSSARTSVLLAASGRDQSRRFNTLLTPDGTFVEGGRSLQLFGRVQRELPKARLSVSSAFDHLERDNLFSELGRAPAETLQQTRDSGFLGLALEGPRSQARLSVLLEKDRRGSEAGNWSKEYQDRDGEGFWPFERRGDFSSLALRLQAERRFSLSRGKSKAELKPFVELSWAQVRGTETVPDHNLLTYDGEAYEVVFWQAGESYRHRRFDLSAGLAFRMDLLRHLEWQGRLFARGQALAFSSDASNLSLWTPGFDLGLTWRPGRRWHLMLALGQIPLELGAQVAFFLEPQRPSGEVWRWRDPDEDLAYDAGEAYHLFGYTGGGHHSVAKTLRCPVQQRLLALVDVNLGKHFQFDVKGTLARQNDQLWVRFAEEYGDFLPLGDRQVYVFTRPYEQYVLGNNDFLRRPFYAELLLRLAARRENRWFFSLSFLSHMGMGVTPFGNGPESDAGIIDESQASRNTWENGFGRVDGDRAFVGKVFFGWQINPQLFLASTVRYRDGASFAFIDAYYRRMLWVLLYKTIKGEDEHGVKGGPREDCVWDINLQLRWRPARFRGRVALEAAVFNLLDFGSELSENVFSGGGRLANELQLPRSLRLGVTVDF